MLNEELRDFIEFIVLQSELIKRSQDIIEEFLVNISTADLQGLQLHKP